MAVSDGELLVLRSAMGVLEPDGVSVAVRLPDQPELFGALPEELLELEACQWDRGDGPGAVAFSCRAPMTITEIERYRDIWPEYADLARRHGICAVAAIPMRVDDTEAGVLSLYSHEPRPWSRRDVHRAALLAAMAAEHILSRHQVRQHQRTTAQLRHALTSRIVVEQAKGVIAHAHGTTTTVAFELIRAHARRNRVTVHAVARGIVELGLRI